MLDPAEIARRRANKVRLLLQQAADEEEAAVDDEQRGHERLIFATNLRTQAICEHLGLRLVKESDGDSS